MNNDDLRTISLADQAHTDVDRAIDSLSDDERDELKTLARALAVGAPPHRVAAKIIFNAIGDSSRRKNRAEKEDAK